MFFIILRKRVLAAKTILNVFEIEMSESNQTKYGKEGEHKVLYPWNVVQLRQWVYDDQDASS